MDIWTTQTTLGKVDTFVHNIEVEDLAIAAIRFENGALGIV
jgi:hypothetical protein